MIYYANCPFCENEFSFDGTEAIDVVVKDFCNTLT